jgi:hypothetical protein
MPQGLANRSGSVTISPHSWFLSRIHVVPILSLVDSFSIMVELNPKEWQKIARSTYLAKAL